MSDVNSEAKRTGYSFAARVQQLRATQAASGAWPTARVRILRNYTLENIVPLLALHGAASRVTLETSLADFDAFEREVRDETSLTRGGKHDAIILSVWLDGLATRDELLSGDVADAGERLTQLVETLLSTTSSLVIVTTLLPAISSLSARRASGTRATARLALAAINARLLGMTARHARLVVVDLEAVTAELGRARALDSRGWYQHHAPLRNETLDMLAAEIASVVVALKGAARKVLVLDCDNTLWGGIVGEDGLEGIDLGPDSTKGRAFLDFQRQILQLQQSGVLVALCSKNNEADVFAVMEEHPYQLLRREHLAAWRINWTDKAANLAEIARELNVGLDSLVFVDDSGVECERVRQAMPVVDVLTVPTPPYEIAGLLRDYRGFDRTAQTNEDARRTVMYQAERERVSARSAFDDVQTYLRSLDLKVRFTVNEPPDLERVAQLTQKTNQFNLTTRRYSEGDVQYFMNSPEHDVIALRVTDRFGDYGLTGVGIINTRGNEARIDTLLMSCRVLGRDVEFALVERLIEVAAAKGATVLVGEYIQTAKNDQVRDFFDRAGFTPTGPSVDGARRYTLEIAAAKPGARPHITIEA